MRVVVWIAVVAAAMFALDRVALWAERRGWIYWRRSGRHGASGAGLIELDLMTNPGARYVVEVKQAEPREERTDDDIVDPPVPDRYAGR